jgi:hypothetical protein
VVQKEAKTEEAIQKSKTLLLSKNQQRSNFVFGYIGTNRTGKSATAKKAIESWKSQNPEKIVIGFDPQNNFTDLIDVEILLTDKNWEYEKVLQYRNALIVLDDYYLIHEKLQPTQGLREIMAFRAQYDYDIIYITHNPALVINFLTFFTTHYYIFFTNVQEGSFKKKIPSYTLCEQASRLINRYVSKFGRGEYPNFPHIIVDNEGAKLIAQNVNKEKFIEVSNVQKINN